MADIFTSVPGRVAVISGEAVMAAFKVEGFPAEAVIITGITYEQSTNQQFMLSLEGAVYTYVFGDKMGMINVSGLMFDTMCNGDGKPGRGLISVMGFYQQRRVTRELTMVKVTIADTVVEGFLTRLRIDPESAEFRLNRYSMTINTLPEHTGAAE